MFKPEFEAAVETGLKRQTIRPVPKRTPKPGDEISCRVWLGKPYRSKQRELYRGTITEVRPIKITNHWIDLDGCLMGSSSQKSLAFSDGFESATQLINWFRREHGLPFSGILIRWHARKGGSIPTTALQSKKKK